MDDRHIAYHTQGTDVPGDEGRQLAQLFQREGLGRAQAHQQHALRRNTAPWIKDCHCTKLTQRIARLQAFGDRTAQSAIYCAGAAARHSDTLEEVDNDDPGGLVL